MTLPSSRSATSARTSAAWSPCRDVSMTVAHGELRAIIGPNGAGKTTFFNLITGFFPPTSGEIVLDGQNINRVPAAAAGQDGHGAHLPDHRDLPRADGARERRASPSRPAWASACAPWLTAADKKARRRRRRRGDDAWPTSPAKADRLVGELSHGDQRAAEIAMALALKPTPAAARRADRRHGRPGDLPGDRPDPPPAPRFASTRSC